MIEGWHGVPYDAPIGRAREIIEICRMVWRRDRLAYQGRHCQLPLKGDGEAGGAIRGGTGLGKPTHEARVRLIERVRALAT